MTAEQPSTLRRDAHFADNAGTGSPLSPLAGMIRPIRRSSVILWLVVAAVMGVVGVAGGGFYISLLTLMFVYGIVNVAWNLLLGYGGVFSFGQLAFFAVGAYTSGLLNIHLGWPIPLTIVLGACTAGVVGLAVGIPSLRLYGPYMVVFTFGFQLALAALIVTDDSGLTGGANGIGGADLISLPGLSNSVSALYVAGIVCIACMIATGLLLRSPTGIAIQALRDSRLTAESGGASLFTHRLVLFSLTSLMTGAAGGIYVHYLGVVTPTIFSVGLGLNLMAMIVLGGLATQFGPLLGTIILVYINDYLSSALEYRSLVWGLLIVVVMLVMRDGLMGLFYQVKNRIGDWVQ